MSVTIEPHRVAQISAHFSVGTRDYGKWNTAGMCPSFKLFGTTMGRKEIVCHGAIRAVFPMSEYNERTSQLSKSYSNFLHRADAREFGVIYSRDERPLYISNTAGLGYCRPG